MALFTAILALSSAVLAAPSRSTHLLPRQTCCFTLAEASTSSPIQQAPEGWLYLGHASHPVETYCLDIEAGSEILRDPANSACFIDPEGQAKCHDVTPSGDEWAIEENRSGERRLRVNGGTDFLACDGRGGEAIWKDGKTGCREIEIELQDLSGGC